MPANIGNNTMASEFERLHGRPAMSSLHAFFSVGGLLGSCSAKSSSQAVHWLSGVTAMRFLSAAFLRRNGSKRNGRVVR